MLGVEKIRDPSDYNLFSSLRIPRLNSGIRNRYNFFLWPIYIFQKVVSDSANHADSGDIKVFVLFTGNMILKILLRF